MNYMNNDEQKFETVEEVHNHALEIVGKSLQDLDNEQSVSGKSKFGDAFERWFGKEKDSASEPDMREAGVELKATPYYQLKGRGKNGEAKYSSKERLALNVINYEHLVEEQFETSHFLHKNRVIELGFYEHVKGVPRDQWQFKEVALYEMAEDRADYEVIRHDWETIQKCVMDGKAENLTETMTDYLAASTKGGKGGNLRTQPFSEVKAKQRAFSLKTSYMRNLLRTRILGDTPGKSIFKGKFDLSGTSLEENVLNRLNRLKGWTTSDLREKFDVMSHAKSFRYLLVSRMLGLEQALDLSVNQQFISEFDKAGIQVKTIRFEGNGRNKQSMSFPAFNFKDLAQQTWNDKNGEASADWHAFLQDTKFLFIVFQMDNGVERFMGAKFFKVPDRDIDGPIREVWQDTVDKLNRGVVLKAKKTTDKRIKSGYTVSNDFIGIGQHLICHVRPHDDNASYTSEIKGGNQLPTPAHWINRPANANWISDDWMTTQCFWFNKQYVREQVMELLK